MAELSHAKAPGELERVHLGQDLAVVLLRAQLGDRAAAEREVHAALDGERVVAEGEALERGLELERVYGGQRGGRCGYACMGVCASVCGIGGFAGEWVGLVALARVQLCVDGARTREQQLVRAAGSPAGSPELHCAEGARRAR